MVIVTLMTDNLLVFAPSVQGGKVFDTIIFLQVFVGLCWSEQVFLLQ